MLERKSLKWPISLAIVMIVLIVGLTVGWILVNVFGAISSQSGSTLYWTLLTVGSIMFALVLTGVILYLVWSIQQVDLNRRQSNFLDAVTHELKSPIASLKLFLQTLHRHEVEPDQRREFYRSMMDDVERLDRLITQLLDVAKLEQDSNEPQQSSWVSLSEIVQVTAEKLIQQYRLTQDAITIQVDPCEIWGKQVDVEILVRNLLDNAIKYSGTPPAVLLQATVSNDESELRMVFQDNGNGVPRHLRRAIFRRFYRVGNELERTKPGTGLGLFIVRAIIKRLGGTIRVEESAKSKGARFVVLLPQVRRVSATPPTNSPTVPLPSLEPQNDHA
ncbi:sensor histidine kinase [Pirellulaceae bacterium SH501]